MGRNIGGPGRTLNRPNRQLARSGSSKRRTPYQCTGFVVRARSGRAQLGDIERSEPRRQQAFMLRDHWTWIVTSDWLEFPAAVTTRRLAPLRAVAGTTMFTW